MPILPYQNRPRREPRNGWLWRIDPADWIGYGVLLGVGAVTVAALGSLLLLVAMQTGQWINNIGVMVWGPLMLICLAAFLIAILMFCIGVVISIFY